MAGVNGCRLNFSHGDYVERDQQIEWIRAAAEKKGRSVAILQDLQGPKIRLGDLKDNHKDVKKGDHLILDHAVTEHDGGNTLPVQYNLAGKVKVDEPISLFDGKVKIEFERCVCFPEIEEAARGVYRYLIKERYKGYRLAASL